MTKALSVASFILWMSVANALDGPQTCNANPGCAALGLADDCCPTNLAGIFLDCCEDFSDSCATNPGCAGLANDCCPTEDGTFLYCCFDDDPTEGGYEYNYTYIGGGPTGNSWYRCGPGRVWGNTGALSIVDGTYTYQYVRNKDLVYDLFYMVGSIPDASDYVTGNKIFSIYIEETTAPPCTQILLQFEHHTRHPAPVPCGDAYNISGIGPYPKSRHSRYLATIPEGGGRVDFEFLDRPDKTVLDADVNAAAILFAPGQKTGDTFAFNTLNSHDKCTGGGNGCEPAPVKACPALYMTVEGANTGLRALEGDCSDCANPSCLGVGLCSVDTSFTSLQEDPVVQEVPPQDVVPTGAPTAKENEELLSATADIMDETLQPENPASKNEEQEVANSSACGSLVGSAILQGVLGMITGVVALLV